MPAGVARRCEDCGGRGFRLGGPTGRAWRVVPFEQVHLGASELEAEGGEKAKERGKSLVRAAEFEYGIRASWPCPDRSAR